MSVKVAAPTSTLTREEREWKEWNQVWEYQLPPNLASQQGDTLWMTIIREGTRPPPTRYSSPHALIFEETARSIETYLNRAAHYHIEAAARGWQTTAEEDGAASNGTIASSSSCDESAIPDFRHGSELPVFYVPSRHSIRARYPKNASPFRSSGMNSIPVIERSRLFSLGIIDEWYRQVSAKMTIPQETQSQVEKVKLQMIMSVIFPLRTLDNGHRAPNSPRLIGAGNLVRVINPKFGFFIHLGCTFDGIMPRIGGNEWPISPRQIQAQEFRSEAKAMAEMNRKSWYHEIERIEEVAHEFITGVRTSNQVDTTLRCYHIRPLQFLGRCYPPSESSNLSSANVVCFILTDGAGIDHEWRVEFSHRPGWTRVYSASRGQVSDGYSVHLNIAPYRIDEIKFYSLPSLSEFTPHISATQQLVLDQLHPLPLHERSVEATTASDDEDIIAKHQKKERDAIADQFKFAYLTAAFRHVIPFTEFSRYGPTLYEENHTPQARRDFTAAMIDVSMATAEMELLPSVILTLISEYHTLPLPFLEDEAAKQMSQYSLVATHSNYPAHNTNPVESPQRQIDSSMGLTWHNGLVVTQSSPGDGFKQVLPSTVNEAIHECCQ